MDARAWDDRYLDPERISRTDPNQFVVESVSGLAPGRALDLACGEGRNSLWLAGLGWEVTGVDWSEVAIGRARERSAEQGLDVTWQRQDLFAWTPPEQAFDLVLIVYLQVPGDQRRLVWGRAAAAVAAGGRLVVIGHDIRNHGSGTGGPRSPEVLYRPEEVAETIGGDLEVVEAAVVRRPVEIDGEIRHAIDNRVVAVRRT